jgi:hypothetical protein
MTLMSHIRRITIISCVVLAGWTSAASASPAYDPIMPSTPAESSAVEPRASVSDGGSDLMLPIVLGATVVLLAIGTAGYAHRTRPGRRTIA